jgi:hypothetical protein
MRTAESTAFTSASKALAIRAWWNAVDEVGRIAAGEQPTIAYQLPEGCASQRDAVVAERVVGAGGETATLRGVPLNATVLNAGLVRPVPPATSNQRAIRLR